MFASLFASTKTSAINSTNRAPARRRQGLAWLFFCLASMSLVPAVAQTGGEAGIQGTVVDGSGAAIPNANVTATNNATGATQSRDASSAGLYTIAPILPGTYTVTARAPGFQGFVQKNFTIDALRMTGLNITMQVGAASAEITVTAAPPALETTNAALGGVMENQTYEQLPLQMSGQQRDPTAFATLLPGVQGGARAPIIGGTGNFLAAVYVDGIPVTTINQQGDNRIVSNAIPVEAIDQFQVVTSTPGAEFQGAGLINFTMKSGSNGYHGTVAAFVRNTIFDTWGFSAPALTQKDANGNTLPAKQPVEHQNELVASGGGPIPFTRHKGFFYATYDKYHGRNGINPNTLTVPTVRMRTGDFGELLTTVQTPLGCGAASKPCTATQAAGIIYDPTTQAACTAAHGGAPCRYAYQGNVIPTGQLSPIALKMESYLPAPTNGNIVNNYLGGVPSGYDNHEFTTRLDFDLTARQRLSYVLSLGTRKNVPFTVGGSPAGVVLPLPYTAGGYATIKPTITDVEHNWQLSERITNQFKFGFARFSQPVGSLTDGAAGYQAAADIGITNLPTGQASTEFPGASFAPTSVYGTVEAPWTSNGASGATQTTIPNTFTLIDNLQITKGRHNVTVGAQIQWLEDNVAGQLGPSGILSIPYSANSTANFSGNTLSTVYNGYSYASFLLGAAGATGVGIQQVAETGGRYRDVSPYVQDDWKITQKLTVNLGLRWDYFPPFHEVQDRWSFLNATLTNAATGNLGALQFAGNRGAGVSCQCRTPVQSYWKNYGPRIGLAYAPTERTVLRAGYALVYSIGGGVGGRQGAGAGTGNLGFNQSANTPAEQTSGVTAGPSFYLNNSAAFSAAGIGNTRYGGPTYTLPTLSAPSAASQTLNTGNYSNGSAYVSPGGIAYADPYLSGRAPEFSFFNAGIQQALTRDLTLTVNYAGTQSHFLLAGGGGRGYYSNQLNPTYLGALGSVLSSDGRTPLLTAKATPANYAILQNNLSGFKTPYANFFASNATSTIAQALVAFPQYSGVSDTWGNIANISYNSLQVSVTQRLAHHVSFTANYTWSKNIGDDGTFRSGYDLPASATSNGVAYKANRIDRSQTTNNIPQNVSVFGVFESPFDRGGLGGEHFLVRQLAGGWQLSHIITYTSGTPVVLTFANCTSGGNLAGQCVPDLNPSYTGNARKGGKYGQGLTTGGLGHLQYLDPNAFAAPATFATACTGSNCTLLNKIGTAPRTAPYGLHVPGRPNLDLSLRRTFNLSPERFRFIFEADCLNVANHPVPTNLNGVVGSAAFGTFSGESGNRDFQFAGRVNF